MASLHTEYHLCLLRILGIEFEPLNAQLIGNIADDDKCRNESNFPKSVSDIQCSKLVHATIFPSN